MDVHWALDSSKLQFKMAYTKTNAEPSGGGAGGFLDFFNNLGFEQIVTRNNCWLFKDNANDTLAYMVWQSPEKLCAEVMTMRCIHLNLLDIDSKDTLLFSIHNQPLKDILSFFETADEAAVRAFYRRLVKISALTEGQKTDFYVVYEKESEFLKGVSIFSPRTAAGPA